MKIVDPKSITTLLLNKYHEPFGICTARAALRHLINGRVMGIDATDSLYSWDGRQPENKQLPASSVSWQACNIQVFDDQPVLRSAPRLNETKYWYIPTIVRCNKQFGYRVKYGKDISLRKIYDIYDGICQYCLEKIPFSDATKDHVFPKSLGGSNHDFNIVLACRKCNNKKDNIYPFFNINGDEVVPRKTLPSGVFVPDNKLIRAEWRKYLFLE